MYCAAARGLCQINLIELTNEQINGSAVVQGTARWALCNIVLLLLSTEFDFCLSTDPFTWCASQACVDWPANNHNLLLEQLVILTRTVLSILHTDASTGSRTGTGQNRFWPVMALLAQWTLTVHNLDAVCDRDVTTHACTGLALLWKTYWACIPLKKPWKWIINKFCYSTEKTVYYFKNVPMAKEMKWDHQSKAAIAPAWSITKRSFPHLCTWLCSQLRFWIGSHCHGSRHRWTSCSYQ